MMIPCLHCGRDFDPQQIIADVAVQAGMILAEERYGDSGKVCGECLANRGRLAMMYDPTCHG